MQVNLDNFLFLVGNRRILKNIDIQKPKEPFDKEVVKFLDTISKAIMIEKASRTYPDVITFAFWCRKASIELMKDVFVRTHDGIESKTTIRYGKGCAFHIAPSNVAVNYAYSLVVGLLSGNTNIVRLPSKYFLQIDLINRGIRKALDVFPQFVPYICIVRYNHDKTLTDYLSLKCDTRIIWGGDTTINNIRKSPLKPRANELTFADRYSISVIDSEVYIDIENKQKIASNFYDDTYLTDQNSCTSPRIVVWLGNEERNRIAQGIFWNKLEVLVEDQYELQPVQAVSKLASVYKIGANFNGVIVNGTGGEKLKNKLVRVQIKELSEDIMKYKDNSGFFMEYYAENLNEIKPLCTSQCQTLSYIGLTEEIIRKFLMDIKPRGIDRVVPIGKTMDFSLVWDGYDLISQMTKIVSYR